MKVNNSMRIFLSLLVLCMMAGIGVAEQQGNLPTDFIQMRLAKQLTVVNGGLCGSMPDDAGSTTYLGFEVFCTGKNGVTSDLTGCVAVWYDSNWKALGDVYINPGKVVIAPYGAAFWERYNCYDVPYTCTDYKSAGCGAKGTYVNCPDDQMLRTRTCSNAPSSIDTERCIPWYDCREGISQACDFSVTYGSCLSGYQTVSYQYEDCSRKTDTQACTIECDNPRGYSGDTDCRNGVMYKCNYDGNWKQIGICPAGSSGSDGSADSGPVCKGPDGYAGEKICLEGLERTCVSDGTWKIGNACTVAEGLSATFQAAFYDPSKNVVIGRVGIRNDGPDMVDTHILEMQVRPEGEAPLAIISDQMVCDPTHPENVHKAFRLNSGEEAIIELEVPASVLGEGTFDVHFMSRHKCYKDLTPDQIAKHDEYQRVPPFKYSEKIEGIKIGNPDKTFSAAKLWKASAAVMLIAGIAMAWFGILPWGFIPFVIGILILLWQYWPW